MLESILTDFPEKMKFTTFELFKNYKPHGR